MPPVDQQFKKCFDWYAASSVKLAQEEVSETRDYFSARHDRMVRELLESTQRPEEIALLSAAISEIGGNCFDHNLGYSRDQPGCWFQYGKKDQIFWVLVADRGQGVRSSLIGVAPELKNDQQALEMAFEKRISGRSPERRGNGLKFVRSAINGHQDRGLSFVCGSGQVYFGGLASGLKKLQTGMKGFGSGTMCCVLWSIKE